MVGSAGMLTIPGGDPSSLYEWKRLYGENEAEGWHERIQKELLISDYPECQCPQNVGHYANGHDSSKTPFPGFVFLHTSISFLDCSDLLF